MKVFVQDIETKNSRIVLMSLKTREEVGAELDKMDQFFRVNQMNNARINTGAVCRT
jgi:hypothetical protein